MTAPRFFWATLVLVVVVIGIGAVAAWGVVTYTGSPDFCASCHVMETRHISWLRSGHAGRATCIECHSDPGLWGEMKAHLNGTRYLYVMLTGEKSGPILKAHVASATCAQCHAPASLPEAAPARRIAHREHLARGVECTACHAGLVHGSLYGHLGQPAIETCAGCHAKASPLAVPGSTARPPVPDVRPGSLPER
jgi:nitrate/TMAO reductase-like tetraheme cytochrome c subunit